MKQRSEHFKYHVAVVIIALQILVSGCASRYHLDLYLTVEEDRRQIQVESTQYVWDAVLGNPYADNKLDEGIGHVAIVTTSTRMVGDKKSLWRGFSSDEYLRCQLYMEVPYVAGSDRTVLTGKTLVHLLGRYELPIKERVFLPKEGFYSLDSITDEELYFTVDGTFTNKSGERLKFDGEFKVGQN
jgi:hypothetical protein